MRLNDILGYITKCIHHVRMKYSLTFKPNQKPPPPQKKVCMCACGGGGGEFASLIGDYTMANVFGGISLSLIIHYLTIPAIIVSISILKLLICFIFICPMLLEIAYSMVPSACLSRIFPLSFPRFSPAFFARAASDDWTVIYRSHSTAWRSLAIGSAARGIIANLRIRFARNDECLG